MSCLVKVVGRDNVFGFAEILLVTWLCKTLSRILALKWNQRKKSIVSITNLPFI